MTVLSTRERNTLMIASKEWQEGFSRFYSVMPDDERTMAVAALKAANLPPSEEFIKAYALGVARIMKTSQVQAAMMAMVEDDEPDSTRRDD